MHHVCIAVRTGELLTTPCRNPVLPQKRCQLKLASHALLLAIHRLFPGCFHTPFLDQAGGC
jgi:hypothetical protein